MKVEVIEPHGFCAGVTAAIKKAVTLAERRRAAGDAAVYCLHELVHNEIVVADLRRRGFVFVESIDEVPKGATVLFSAHGVSPAVRASAAERNLEVIDATCPFVMRVHKAAQEYNKKGLTVVIIGKRSHAEVKGILGEAPDAVVVASADEARALELPQGAGTRLGVVSQTTMNADDVRAIVAALAERFDVESVAEVCNATKERQDAVKAFDGDALLVLGSANSSNTRRLCEVARCRTFRAGSLEELGSIDFTGIDRLGITSGASTPESFFKSVCDEFSSAERGGIVIK